MIEFIRQVFGIQYDTNMICLQFKWMIFCPILFAQAYIHWRALKSFFRSRAETSKK